MGKFLVRIVVIIVALYFLFTSFIAQFLGLDIHYDTYILLFECIVMVYTFSEGKYHCKYMKYTMCSIFFAELITRLDNLFDFLSVDAHNLIPAVIIALGLATSTILAIRHFYKVLKIKKNR